MTFPGARQGLADAATRLEQGQGASPAQGGRAGSVVARGARNAVTAASGGLSVGLREAQGAGSLQATAAAQPMLLQTHALFNPALDYVDVLLAALMPAVIQLMAAAATTYAVSLDFGPGRHAASCHGWQAGYCPQCWASCCHIPSCSC